MTHEEKIDCLTKIVNYIETLQEWHKKEFPEDPELYEECEKYRKICLDELSNLKRQIN